MSATELHYCTGLVGLAAAWGSLAVAVGALLVGLVAGTLWRWRGARRDAAAVAEGERELESVRHVASALARTQDVEGVARALLDEIAALFDVDFVALAFVSEDAREASGFLARSKGEDVDWWREMRLDLTREPSGIASAVQAADGFAVYDVADTRVSTKLAVAVGAKSAAYVPLISADRVIAVISVATTSRALACSPPTT